MMSINLKRVQNSGNTVQNSDELLITATAGVNQKLSPRFQRLLLLHTSAQGLYSELLELHEKVFALYQTN